MSSIKKTTNVRYERKCRIDRDDKQEVRYYIQHHPALFRKLYAPRQINNIYFDTQQFAYYKANEIGIANRKKVRIRWYGALGSMAISPQLEIKIKRGLVGDKLVYPLKNFSLSNEISPNYFIQLAKKSQLPEAIVEELYALRPSLVNTYKRSYFQSADKKFRLTFDEDLSFYRPTYLTQPFSRSTTIRDAFILELKYQLEHDALARELFQYFPYRLSKNSKYVNGIDLLQLI